MMTLDQKINSLVLTGNYLKNLDSAEMDDLFRRTESENPWFTRQNIMMSVESVRDQFLQEPSLRYMATKYNLNREALPKKVGLILAGNIPLVGFHDVLCCYLAGHISLIKYSDKDNVLMPFMVDLIKKCSPGAASDFIAVEKLSDYDAVIATGSNTSATQFEYYFREVPHLIRRNRNSIAVLSGNESSEELQSLACDVFSYFGLGCRNVSKIFVPQNYEVTQLFDAFNSYSFIINHNKYKNNYDYNVALNLINKEPFFQNDMFILKESESLFSRIGCVHYQRYSDISMLMSWLHEHRDEIQCIVTNLPLQDMETVSFGQAQCPAIDTYADGVDTMEFLLKL